MRTNNIKIVLASLAMLMLLVACGNDKPTSKTSTASVSKTKVAVQELTDSRIEDIVRRSYQYVAMYNVNNKFALKQGGGGIPVMLIQSSMITRCGKLPGPTTTHSTSAACSTCARTR